MEEHDLEGPLYLYPSQLVPVSHALSIIHLGVELTERLAEQAYDGWEPTYTAVELEEALERAKVLLGAQDIGVMEDISKVLKFEREVE